MPLTDTTDPMTAAEAAHKRAVADLAHAFIGLAQRLGVPHRQALEALATAYLSVAEVHSCCLPFAASAAHGVAAHLDRAAAELPAPHRIH